MSDLKLEAPPMSRVAIRMVADRFRSVFNQQNDYLNVVRIIEHGLPVLMGDSFHFAVLEPEEMGANHGQFSPMTCELALRNDVYDGLVAGNGRDRFTACHEIGHLVLHRNLPMARSLSFGRTIERFRDPEWQANTFAGALLVPADRIIWTDNELSIADRFGVSIDAARVQLDINRRANDLRRK